MKYRMLALENEGPTRMWAYNEGDPLRRVGLFSFEADTVPEALEALWVVGNKMGVDCAGRDWPADRRSMCVGDVVVVSGNGSWVVANFGFVPLAGREN